MIEITEYTDTELTREIAEPIGVLCARSFKDSKRSLEERVNEMLSFNGSQEPEHTTGRRYVIWKGRNVIAHARTFVRQLFVGDEPLSVLALAAVCSDPDMRGQGLGVLVTKAAFQRVNQPGWPQVSLFQTPVPDFYKKLDCRLVENQFVNRRNIADPNANPWRDPHVMIYPSVFAWQTEVVDMNGPDY